MLTAITVLIERKQLLVAERKCCSLYANFVVIVKDLGYSGGKFDLVRSASRLPHFKVRAPRPNEPCDKVRLLVLPAASCRCLR
jgi:hypothetical protein